MSVIVVPCTKIVFTKFVRLTIVGVVSGDGCAYDKSSEYFDFSLVLLFLRDHYFYYFFLQFASRNMVRLVRRRGRRGRGGGEARGASPKISSLPWVG